MDEVLTIADGGHLDGWSGHGLFVIVKSKEIFQRSNDRYFCLTTTKQEINHYE